MFIISIMISLYLKKNCHNIASREDFKGCIFSLMILFYANQTKVLYWLIASLCGDHQSNLQDLFRRLLKRLPKLCYEFKLSYNRLEFDHFHSCYFYCRWYCRSICYIIFFPNLKYFCDFFIAQKPQKSIPKFKFGSLSQKWISKLGYFFRKRI